MMAHSLELLGGSSHMWKYKHNVAHHSFTNIEGMDEDIDIVISQSQNKIKNGTLDTSLSAHLQFIAIRDLLYIMWDLF